jgi:hypothetical protein
MKVWALSCEYDVIGRSTASHLLGLYATLDLALRRVAQEVGRPVTLGDCFTGRGNGIVVYGDRWEVRPMDVIGWDVPTKVTVYSFGETGAT